MTRVFLGWGLLLGAIGLLGIVVFGFSDPSNRWLLIGVCAAMVTLAAVLWATGYGRNLIGGARALPDASPPVPLLAAATVLAAIGAELGWWLSLVGAGLGVVALGGLIREARAQRRDLRASLEREGDPVVVERRGPA